MWTLVECLRCGLQFFDPLRHPGASYYFDTYSVFRDAARRFYAPGWNHRQFLAEPPHSVRHGHTLLDVGCGPGTFLAEARALGYQILGVDINAAALQQATTLHGLTPDQLFAGALEDWIATFPERRVDVVTAFEVLEHLEDPGGFLRAAHRALTTGGFLALSVPNRDRLLLRREWSDQPPHHLTRWSEGALCRALETHGFSVLRVATQSVTARGSIHHLLDGSALSQSWHAARARAAGAVAGFPGALTGIRVANGVLRALTYAAVGLPAILLTAYGRLRRRPGSMLYVLARARS